MPPEPDESAVAAKAAAPDGVRPSDAGAHGPKPEVLQAVLFDMDGTLVATEELWHTAEVRTMAMFGEEWTEADSEFSRGGPFDRVVLYMAERLQADSGDVARILVTEIEHLMHTADLPWMPGAQELLDECRAAGVPVALVSNSWRVLVQAVLDEKGITFDAVITGDEASATKPDPAPFLQACTALGVAPERSVAIEDSMTGLTSADRAGCVTLAVTESSAIGDHAPGHLRRSLAGVTLGDLDAMVREGHTG